MRSDNGSPGPSATQYAATVPNLERASAFACMERPQREKRLVAVVHDFLTADQIPINPNR